MPRVPVHTSGDAPAQSREALRRLERRMGRLLNIHAEMAYAPVVLAANQAMGEAIATHGSFGARTREAIALTAPRIPDWNEAGYDQKLQKPRGATAEASQATDAMKRPHKPRKPWEPRR
jgi:hypothetical protein